MTGYRVVDFFEVLKFRECLIFSFFHEFIFTNAQPESSRNSIYSVPVRSIYYQPMIKTVAMKSCNVK